MSTIPKISSDQEQKLMRALTSVVNYLEDGQPALDAVVKAAAHHDLPAGHIPLLTQAFNAGQALQKQAADTYAERASDYTIVDSADVVERLFPTQQKQAAFAGISSDYTEHPDWLQPAPAASQYVKQASLDTFSLTPELRADRMQGFCDRSERDLQDAATEITALELEANRTLEKLANYFGPHGYIPGNLPADAVRENAGCLWGRAAEKIIDTVTTVKAAGFRHIHQVKQDAAPYAWIMKVAEIAKDLPYKKAAYAAAQQRHQAWIDKHPQLFTTWARTPPTIQKQANGLNLSQILGVTLAKDAITGLSSQMQQPNEEGLVQKELANLGSPEHETELRDISSRAMLQDLLVNDPVLSRHDPHELARAFNSLSMLAPQAMTNPELVTGVLRKRMEAGGLEPFELQGLTSIDSGMRRPVQQAQPRLPSPQSA